MAKQNSFQRLIYDYWTKKKLSLSAGTAKLSVVVMLPDCGEGLCEIGLCEDETNM